MSDPRSAALVCSAIAAWQEGLAGPLVVALDGHGAAGKSTLAEAVAAQLGAVVVRVDDFFRPAGEAGIDGVPMSAYYDWQRLRHEALEGLVAGRRVSFAAFDWERDRLRPGFVELAPATVILVEGVSAGAPALGDLVDRSVLVVTPEEERLRRLHERISDEIWDERWLEEERAYFATRPPESFDLVVSGSAGT